jgi:hypothetical protein
MLASACCAQTSLLICSAKASAAAMSPSARRSSEKSELLSTRLRRRSAPRREMASRQTLRERRNGAVHCRMLLSPPLLRDCNRRTTSEASSQVSPSWSTRSTMTVLPVHRSKTVQPAASRLRSNCAAMGRRGRDVERYCLQGLGGLQLSSRGPAAAGVAFHLEAQLLAFMKRRQACALHGQDVHEHVAAAILGLDEAKTLLAVEPLYGAGSA